jgi:RNA recognition motif. (a.k.a. RRM, RBD, or RNP domain)
MSQSGWLFFDGLSKNFFSQLLNDLCQKYGRVLSANTFMDADGCCIGSGYVEMETLAGAQQAAKELDGSMVLGHVIHVYVIDR